MRIALIVDHDVGLLCGASRQFQSYADWLADNGHDVLLVYPSPRRQRSAPRPGLGVHSIPAFPVPAYREYSLPLVPLAFDLWLRKRTFDVIHCETMNATLLFLGYWLRARSKTPMFNVLTANLPYYAPILLPKDNILKRFVFAAGKALMNAVSNRIEGTFILSEGTRKPLTEEFFRIDPGRVFSLLRPLDPVSFAARNAPCGLSPKYGIPAGRCLVTLSRLCRTKNVEFLIRAFARHIFPEDPSLHLIVAGDGPFEKGLRELAAGLGCPHIHFPGRIPYPAVPAFLREADYFLYSSLSETFGNVVCEAKYGGAPVVALDDRGGVRSQVLDRKTGILVRRHDEADFGRRFFELFRNPELQEEIRRQARQDVLVNHSPKKIYRALVSIYEQTARDGKPDPEMIRQAFTPDRSFLESRISAIKTHS